MGLPTMIQANMTSEQLEAYTLHLRIEEISQKLRINDVVPSDGDRYVPVNWLPDQVLTFLGHLHHHHSTIISVVVSILENTATERDSKTNDTSWSRRR